MDLETSGVSKTRLPLSPWSIHYRRDVDVSNRSSRVRLAETKWVRTSQSYGGIKI